VTKARERHAWWDTGAPSSAVAWWQVAMCAWLTYVFGRWIAGGEDGWQLVVAVAAVAFALPGATLGVLTALWLRRTQRAGPESSDWPFSDEP
jgi:hypothetical protein